MSDARIEKALSRLFDKHRVVFWYDEKQELRKAFEALELPGVEKVEIANNEFGLKYRILREQPKQAFLLYKEDAAPAYEQNWLLDVQLAQGEFRTDQTAIWLNELELPNEFNVIVDEHSAFFENAKRRAGLKHLLAAEDTQSVVRVKMLAVCAGADARIDSVLEQLLHEEAQDKADAFKLLERCGLDGFLWQQLERYYGYVSEKPSIKDFVITLMGWSYFQGVGSQRTDIGVLNNESLVFLNRWKDSRKYQDAFEQLSAECAEILGIEADLHKREITDLAELDQFYLIDQRIITGLVDAVAKRTVSPGDVVLWCRQRRMSHWYSELADLYSAIEYASQFVAFLDAATFDMPNPSDGYAAYTGQWFRLDQWYRQYIHALKVSGKVSLLAPLTEQLENLYTNRYLMPLNNEWQRHVDSMAEWQVPGTVPQRDFFHKWVRPYVAKEQRICVVISDALRYEAGEEMVSRICREDRYQAEISSHLSSLPSYTQLGMAALLPRIEGDGLCITDDKMASVSVGELSSQGTAGRDKLLKRVLGERAAAIQSKALMDMTAADSRELLKAHDVIYFYHNRIDHTGDKMQSEGEAFEATEKTFDDLMRIVKKLANANASNILITADHGFIYQDRPLSESDYLDDTVEGDVTYRDRRFVLGRGLRAGDGLKAFSAAALGLGGDVSAVIPKGIQRLRLKGSGSRFVHGGASLQEVVVPVIKVNKKRQSDIRQVEVDIIRSGSTIITSGQLAVVLYQVTPVDEKVQLRQLRVGIYADDSRLISDQHEVVMDLTSDNPREREMKLRFLLSAEADAYNNQEVLLRLDEPVSGTSKYQEYKSVRYTLRRSFTSDFDF